MSAICCIGMAVIALFILCIFSSLELMTTSMTVSLDDPEALVVSLGVSSFELFYPLTFFAFGLILIFSLMTIYFVIPEKPKPDSNQ